MGIKGIIFDLYGTLIDIETDESMEEIYRAIAHFLTYKEIYIHIGKVRDLYYQLLKQEKEKSREEYPEISVEAIWEAFLARHGLEARSGCHELAVTLAYLYRGISRKRLQLYPSVKSVLDELRPHYRMGIVSDGQPCWALPEMRALGLGTYFDPVIMSADHGFRKPDPRLIKKALDLMGVTSSEVLFVGNDMYRDIHGAGQLNIKTIFLSSNQGRQSYSQTTADYVATEFEGVLRGVKLLTSGSLVDGEVR
jgi:putative hydrolase of the HAD superfamily